MRRRSAGDHRGNGAGAGVVFRAFGQQTDCRAPGTIAAHLVIGLPSCYINDSDHVGRFLRADIDALLDTQQANCLGWSSDLAPAIMGAPGQPELGEELTNSFCRTDPDIARHFARVTFLSEHRAELDPPGSDVLFPFESSGLFDGCPAIDDTWLRVAVCAWAAPVDSGNAAPVINRIGSRPEHAMDVSCCGSRNGPTRSYPVRCTPSARYCLTAARKQAEAQGLANAAASWNSLQQQQALQRQQQMLIQQQQQQTNRTTTCGLYTLAYGNAYTVCNESGHSKSVR